VSRHVATAPCPVAAACGGCPLLETSPAVQAKTKLDRVRDALRSAGAACGPLPDPEWIAAPQAFGYRNRIRVRFDAGGRLAFFNENKSLDCVVLDPALRRALAELRQVVDRCPETFAHFAHAEVRVPGLDGRPSLYLVPKLSGALERVQLAVHGWWVEIAGENSDVRQRYALRDSWWDVPLGGFMQVNTAVNELLVSHAVAGAIDRRLGTFLDLFCGAGNFALPLARSGQRGTAVELDDRAVRAARDAAREQGLDHLEVGGGDARTWSDAALLRDERFDLVVLDPPRAGLKDGAATFAALARHHVLLCSCDANALGRDLRALQESGFDVESVTAFDMFPQTAHVEVAIWLRRARSR
jgi:23S rRNA (uracil1939-C5)-methyltransferase